jgi:hypothetical protein
MNSAKLHDKIGTVFRFIALAILPFPCQHLSGFDTVEKLVWDARIIAYFQGED